MCQEWAASVLSPLDTSLYLQNLTNDIRCFYGQKDKLWRGGKGDETSHSSGNLLP